MGVGSGLSGIAALLKKNAFLIRTPKSGDGRGNKNGCLLLSGSSISAISYVYAEDKYFDVT